MHTFSIGRAQDACVCLVPSRDSVRYVVIIVQVRVSYRVVAIMKTVAEIIFLLYFVSHIFITVLFDSQLLLPKWLYPTAVSFYSRTAVTIDYSQNIGRSS